MRKSITQAFVAVFCLTAFQACARKSEPLNSLDFTMPSAWAVLPDPPPPAIWEMGWDVDIFLIAPTAQIQAKSPQGLTAAAEKARKDTAGLASDLRPLGVVYAPLLRKDSLAEDARAAFEQYVTHHNRGRALVIVTSDASIAPALARLQSDTLLQSRFGGFLTDLPAEDAKALDAYCAGGLPELVPCRSSLPFSKVMGAVRAPLIGELVRTRMIRFRRHLEADVAKLAPPLGALEEVEVVEARSPGDTDEARESRRSPQ